MNLDLKQTNRLVLGESGVWRINRNTVIPQNRENRRLEEIRRILEDAEDLSSHSVELERRCPESNFEAQFQLSPCRSNLLRGLKLSGIRTALEIGCECGAVTRYLGEKGIAVDAVEPCLEKAELAKIRCSGFEKVEIIHSDISDLAYPAQAYDAIVMIGIFERIRPGNLYATSKDGTIPFIMNICRALEERGILLIAAGNRMGLKSWLGASDLPERTPFAGLYGYRKDGFSTWDKKDWEKILEKSGIMEHRFCFPFPDHQFPKVILSDRFIEEDDYAHSLLYRVASQDRFRSWTPCADEYLLWKAMHQAGRLSEFANSFLILASNLKETLDTVINKDFTFFSDIGRRPAYRTITEKPRHEDIVFKKSIQTEKGVKVEDQTLEHSPSIKAYLRGKLLSDFWLEALLECRIPDSFEALLKSYYGFIQSASRDSSFSAKLVDVLPFNIIVDESGAYQTIDEEWVARNSYPPEFVLFRALIWFGKASGILLKPLLDIQKIENIRGLVEYGFHAAGADAANRIDAFISMEEALQTEVNFQKGLNNILRMVEEPFLFPEEDSRSLILSGQLFWADGSRVFSENKSVYAMVPMAGKRAILFFPFFTSGSSLKWLKLKPMNCPGFFILENLLLKWTDSIFGKEKVLMRFSDSREIADAAALENLVFSDSETGGMFLSTGFEPYILIPIDERALSEVSGGYLSMQAEIIRPKGSDFKTAEKVLARARRFYEEDMARQVVHQDKLFKTIEGQNRTIEGQNRTIEGQNRTIQTQRISMYGYERRIRHLEFEITTARQGLSGIRKSPYWMGILVLLRAFDRGAQTLKALFSPSLIQAYSRIRKTAIFDARYYLRQNPNVETAGWDPVWHYVKTGCRKGKKPHPLFDPKYYLEKYPEIAAAGMDPLNHYLTQGADEGRKPNPLFDPKYYLPNAVLDSGPKMNPLERFILSGAREEIDPHPVFSVNFYLSCHSDVKESGINPLVHYLQTGGVEGRTPCPLFDPGYYLYRYMDFIEPGTDPLIHYLENGGNHGYDPSPVFDTSFYTQNYPEVLNSNQTPLEHYLTVGAKEGKSPTPVFNIEFYLAGCPDARKSKLDPVSHYLEFGAKEGRNPGILFDTLYYISKNPDVDATKLNPLIHYLESGGIEGRNPSPLFDGSYYMSKYPDVRDSGINPLVHYLKFGGKEGRSPSPLFDACYYASQNPGMEASELSHLEHFLSWGGKSGKNPNPVFDSAYYLNNNPDVQASGMNPLVHYLEFGAKEGRNPGPLFDSGYYLEENVDVAKSDSNPLAHYLEYGGVEGRNPNPVFRGLYYLSQNPEVLEAGTNPLVHYITSGAANGKNPSSFFDTSFYMNQNPEVRKSGVNPLAHYLMQGMIDGKSPNPFIDKMSYNPLISIIKLSDYEDETSLEKKVVSAVRQIYRKFELVLVMDMEVDERIRERIDFIGINDPRIKPIYAEQPGSPAAAFNKGISAATGEFLLFIGQGELKIEALFEYAMLLNQRPDADMIFCDQGMADAPGIRVEDYTYPELKLSLNYFVGKNLLLRKKILEEVGGFDQEMEGPEDREFLLKFIQKTRPDRILSISKKLFRHSG